MLGAGYDDLFELLGQLPPQGPPSTTKPVLLEQMEGELPCAVPIGISRGWARLSTQQLAREVALVEPGKLPRSQSPAAFLESAGFGDGNGASNGGVSVSGGRSLPSRKGKAVGKASERQPQDFTYQQLPLIPRAAMAPPDGESLLFDISRELRAYAGRNLGYWLPPDFPNTDGQVCA